MEYKIIKLIQENKDTRTFRLVPVKGKVFDFLPGQFVMLSAKVVKNGKEELVKRAYSLANAPSPEFIELTIRRIENGLM